VAVGILSMACGQGARGQEDITNTKLGNSAFSSNTTGRYDTAIGYNVLGQNTTGSDNTGLGAHCLRSNETGDENTAAGQLSLATNIDGNANTAVGSYALAQNASGSGNTATGADALTASTANYNTADGWQALKSNKSGEINVATGARALFGNTKGNNNAAHGGQALISNKIGNNNTANGTSALFQNTQGNRNTAAGFESLKNNTTGDNNIAIGAEAGINLTVGNNNIAIGAVGTAGEANTIRIGKAGTQTRTFIQGIYGSPVSGGQQVYVTASGKLGVVATSSAKFKQEIKPIASASEAILDLQPVTFRYKPELDADDVAQFGLIAEEVEKVNPDLVVRDDDGKVNGVRYEAVNAMLLNEFLKEHRKVQGLEQELAALKAAMQEQARAIHELTASQVASTRAP